jgi:hypothetical protein
MLKGLIVKADQLGSDYEINRRRFLECAFGTLVAGAGIVTYGIRDAMAQLGPAGTQPMANSRLFTFVGSDTGAWSVTDTRRIAGDAWASAKKISIVNGAVAEGSNIKWQLRGVTSNERYVTRSDKNELVNRQQGLGRANATEAALIPIRKNAAWWALTQDERRAMFEEQSHHTAIGLKYLPEVARRLHHCRDLGTDEPFDFLTWFEFAPSSANAFDQLLADLRATKEWSYVDREIEIRLVRDAG